MLAVVILCFDGTNGMHFFFLNFAVQNMQKFRRTTKRMKMKRARKAQVKGMKIRERRKVTMKRMRGRERTNRRTPRDRLTSRKMRKLKLYKVNIVI